MTAAQLVQALRDRTFNQNVLDALKSLHPSDRSAALEKELIETLESSDDPRVRNAAAIASSDIKSTEALKHVRKLLLSPRTDGSRGTLLYALREAGVRLSLHEVIDLLMSDSVEVREGAFDLLESKQIDGFADSELRSGIKRLESAHRKSSSDKRDLLEHALDILQPTGE